MSKNLIFELPHDHSGHTVSTPSVAGVEGEGDGDSSSSDDDLLVGPTCSVKTPKLLHSHTPPWAQETPDPTPHGMSWRSSFGFDDEEDSSVSAPKRPQSATLAATAALVTPELLRTVCAPFFDKMIEAVQHAVLEQLDAAERAASSTPARVGDVGPRTVLQTPIAEPLSVSPMPSSISQPVSRVTTLQSSQTMRDEASTVGSTAGKRDSTISIDLSQGCFPLGRTSSAGKPVDAEASHPVPARGPATAQEFQTSAADGGNASLSNENNSRALVCCHWKNKGWCRLEGDCKFQHPEHKRGIGAAVAGADTTKACGKKHVKRRNQSGASVGGTAADQSGLPMGHPMTIPSPHPHMWTFPSPYGVGAPWSSLWAPPPRGH
mmetsp:Transcript_70655/g.196541  ORF Transcript_70655/g.196541 Transcript_70655/m.196541 type:complete len:377 (-) Transcript_70655:152-1282(-)